MIFTSIFIGILLCPTSAKRRLDETDREARGEAKKGNDYLKRALKEAKRVGEAIDPDAMSQIERAWNGDEDGLHPGFRQVEDEVLRIREDMQAFGEKMQGIVGDIHDKVRSRSRKGAMLDGDWSGGSVPKWDALTQQGATEMIKDLSSEVLGDAANDAVAAFEGRLAEALSEGNIRAAFDLWHRLLDIPGVQLLTRNRKLWEGAKGTVRKYLNGFMTVETRKDVHRAVNATADFALHFAGLSRNVGKTDNEIFQEISQSMCHLQGATEKLWPLMKRALPLLGYEAYISSADSVIRASVMSRVTLTVTASSLLGMSPFNDPFVMSLIAAFALGHLSKDLARNLAEFFVKAFTNPSTFERESRPKESGGGEERERKKEAIDPVDLATKLVSGTSTCQELGQQSFEFFEAVKRALALPAHPSDGGAADKTDDHDPALRGRRFSDEASTSSQNHRLHPARKLNSDGLVLRRALWVAGLVDHPAFHLDVFLMAIGICFLICCMALGASCRDGIGGYRRRQPWGREARKKKA